MASKQIAEIEDSGPPFYGHIQVPLFQSLIAEGVVMVCIATQEKPLLPIGSNIAHPDGDYGGVCSLNS
jgi:hypothetical protein